MLLITLTSGLSLIGVATVLLDLALVYLVPLLTSTENQADGKVYEDAKYIDTAYSADYLWGNSAKFFNDCDYYEPLLTKPTTDIEFTLIEHNKTDWINEKNILNITVANNKKHSRAMEPYFLWKAKRIEPLWPCSFFLQKIAKMGIEEDTQKWAIL